MADLDAVTAALADLKDADAKALIQDALDAGTPATNILAACQAALAEVGARFETGEYFISELMFAGEVMKEIMAGLAPHLGGAAPDAAGRKTVVFGTVRGDIHDIGKDVCILMLRGAGYRVVDLGINVAPEAFVDAVREHSPSLVAMSVFLTTCCKAIAETVEGLKAAGLREGLAVIIGGAAASDFVAEHTGCDAFGRTAVDAVTLAAKVAG